MSPKILCRSLKSSSLDPTQTQINLVHIPMSSFSKIHFNIMLPFNDAYLPYVWVH